MLNYNALQHSHVYMSILVEVLLIFPQLYLLDKVLKRLELLLITVA